MAFAQLDSKVKVDIPFKELKARVEKNQKKLKIDKQDIVVDDLETNIKPKKEIGLDALIEILEEEETEVKEDIYEEKEKPVPPKQNPGKRSYW